MWIKKFVIDFNNKFYNFQKIIYHTKKNERNHIERLHAKHILLALMRFNFFWKKMLWIIIIISNKACVAIDISKKIKWFIMNVIFNIA